MIKHFDWQNRLGLAVRSRLNKRLWTVAVCLAVVNLAVLCSWVSAAWMPNHNAAAQMGEAKTIAALQQRKATHLKTIWTKVETARRQTADFRNTAILPKRTAYAQVIAELQRMSGAAGLQIRDAVFSSDPIEGTADLSLLNVTASYQGTYESLMHFLHNADNSPMLLMLDNMQASPKEKGDNIEVAIRFQTLIQDDNGQ